ncbi:proline/glycine betaine transporter [Pseudescherichia vulneris]|nr:proline/glycine betaine transporter [Pseudescherichia vulneris]
MSENARPLNRQDYKTLSLAALGGALEFYDFIIFVFFAAVVGALFFPADIPEWLRQVQTFGIFAAGYLARPLGGIIMAHFGDLVGRKKMFTLSILLMAVPTPGDWPAAHLRLYRHCRAAASAADASFTGRSDWRRGAGRMGLCC